MPSTQSEGLGYPTFFLKRRGSVIRNNFPEYRTKQAACAARASQVLFRQKLNRQVAVEF